MTQISIANTSGSYRRDRDNDDDEDRPLTPPMPEAGKLWIHCNNCFEQYAVRKIAPRQKQDSKENGWAFFLLACKHVTCKICVTARLGRTPSDAPIFVCRICRKTVRGRQMDNTLVSNLKIFFHPEPWTLCSDEINSFQAKNMKHFDKYKSEIEAKMIKDENDRDFARKICRRHYLNSRLLVVERRKLWQRFQQIKMEFRIRREQRARDQRMSKSPQHGVVDAVASRRSSGTSIIGRRSSSPPNSHLVDAVSVVLGKGNIFSPAAPHPGIVSRRSITSFSNPANDSFDL